MARYPNKIRYYRLKQRLSQRDLSENTGIPLSILQRIEAGISHVRLGHLKLLSKILERPIHVLYPKVKKAAPAVLTFNEEQYHEWLKSDEAEELLNEVGIDEDGLHWFVKLRLRNRQVADYHLSGIDKVNLAAGLYQNAKSFLIFDSQGVRVAINSRHTLVWQFLYETILGPKEDEEKDAIRLFLSDSRRAMEFSVERDSAEIGKEEDDGQPTQLQYVFERLSMIETDDVDETISFVDEDGEDVVIRIGEIVLLEVPLWAVEPSLEDTIEDDPESKEDLTPGPQLVQ